MRLCAGVCTRLWIRAPQCSVLAGIMRAVRDRQCMHSTLTFCIWIPRCPFALSDREKFSVLVCSQARLVIVIYLKSRGSPPRATPQGGSSGFPRRPTIPSSDPLCHSARLSLRPPVPEMDAPLPSRQAVLLLIRFADEALLSRMRGHIYLFVGKLQL